LAGVDVQPKVVALNRGAGESEPGHGNGSFGIRGHAVQPDARAIGGAVKRRESPMLIFAVKRDRRECEG
jgi:hypothetical protein